MFGKVMIGYDAIINFIDCRKEVNHKISELFADMHDENEDLMDAELHLIQDEMNKTIEAADEMLRVNVQESFREIIKPI